LNALSATDEKVKAKAAKLKDYTNWDGVPAAAIEKLSKLGVVFDTVIDEYAMDAVAIRCWLELEAQLHVSPCVLLSEMNDRGMVTACEVDVGNAVTMYGLSRASGNVATCLDWNNNYGDDDNKCILFHCGPVPQSMMTAKGQVTDHLLLAKAVGPGRGWGCNTGRIAPTPFTYGSMITEDGKLKFYVGHGRFNEDSIPKEFFGCAGVAEFDNLQDALQTIGYAGHRHHTSVTPGQVAAPVQEAFEKYLGYEVTRV
jgi:L-fucose isomerase-like protein